MVRKFVGNTLRQLSYRIKQSECYKVPSDLTAPKLNPVKEEENEEDDDITPAPDQSPEPTTMYYKHLVSPTRDHQMTTLITQPRQDESYTNPITLEPISTTPELHYDETSECTQQEKHCSARNQTKWRLLLLNAANQSMSRCDALPVLVKDLHFTPIKKTCVY